MAALLGLALWLLPTPAQAAGASVVVEIDGAAERLVDARSARRLIPLELSDVTVPRSRRGDPTLFLRVLGRADGALRIELWERGEFHGQRVLSGAGENPQLVARRVALAAAELARRLARKREAALARAERQDRARRARAAAERARTQDGPLALRSELAFANSARTWLVGSRLTAEATLAPPLRVDLGAELWTGRFRAEHGLQLEGLSVAPAYRFVVTRWLDVDAGLRATALLLQLPSATALDGVTEQDSSWTARVDAGARVELRLTRQLRALLGVETGALLRSPTFTIASRNERLSGAWWGASFGLVVTPPR